MRCGKVVASFSKNETKRNSNMMDSNTRKGHRLTKREARNHHCGIIGYYNLYLELKQKGSKKKPPVLTNHKKKKGKNPTWCIDKALFSHLAWHIGQKPHDIGISYLWLSEKYNIKCQEGHDQ